MAKKKKNYNLLLYELQKEAVNNAKITGGKVSNSELEKIAQDEYLAPIRNVNLGRRAAEATDRKKKQEIITKAKENTKSSTSSNKTTTSKKTTSPTKKRTWFTSGAFSDGYQFGDLTKTITGTVTDINEDIAKGILGIGEGLLDSGAYLLGGGAKLIGQEGFSQDMKNFISRDLVEESGAAKLITDLSAPAAINNIVNKEIPFSKDSNAFEQDSLLGDRSDSLVQSGGQLLGTVGLQAVGVPWFVTTGVTSFGSGTEEAFNEDATYGEAGVYGLVAAGAEILTEKLSGGISFGGKTLDDTLLKPLTEKIASKTVQKITNFGLDMVGEGIEEVASEVIQNVGKKLTYEDEKTWGELLTSEEAMDAYLESFIGGFVLGGVGSASQSFAENQSQAQIQGLQQEIAKKTEELNNTEDPRAKQIIQETINVLNEELNELTNAQQITDEKELRKQNFTYQAQENDSDIKKAVYESASKVMNNTTTTHKFVDVVAKIAEERGTIYEFTNTEEIKQGNHNVGDNIIDGFVQDGKVKINVDSPKFLNVILGHETTHLLENKDKQTGEYSKEYKALKQIAIDFAKSKGDYDARIERLTKLYEGTDADIEAELTSDIVGEYLFTDYNFVKELSVKQPTIFEKIRNFISDLVVKFKGTEQEKQLRQLQRSFEKAYKAQGKQTTDTKYSLTDNQGRELSKEQQEYFKDSKVRDENGNLLTVYHGTRSDFNIFDIKRAGQNYEGNWSALGKGFYFTHNNETAKDYSTTAIEGNNANVKEVYLDIKNPFYTGENYSDKLSQLKEKYNIDDFTLRKGYRLIQALNHNGYDSTKVLQELGYDGVIDQYGEKIEEVVAFNSNQIKNVDNTNPTTDPDIRYSVSDNQGRTLSKGQQEYFKDSKVRDVNGNLLTVYHATDSEFTVFDKGKIGSGNGGASFGQGFYFATYEDLASDYGGTIGKYYLNIKRPFDYYSTDKEYIVDMLEKSGYDYDKDFVNSYDFDELYDGDFMEDFLWEALKGKNPYSELSKMLQNAGFDGIEAGSEIVAFEPEQIKNVDNTNPTTDPDIRYSLSEEGKMVDNRGNEVKLEATEAGTHGTLMAIHNLDVSKIKGILELGGFPVPSIAVLDPNKANHSQFGQVSVVFDSSTIDPKNKKNEVYDRDIWSPTFPQVNFDINNETLRRMIDENNIYSNH